MHLGRKIAETYGIPVYIQNYAGGGAAIGNILGNVGTREKAIAAGVSGRLKAVLWYQGEADVRYWDSYAEKFGRLYQQWKDWFPCMKQCYVCQIHVGPDDNQNGSKLREVQRTLPELYGVKIMSTCGLIGHDGVHYSRNGYLELGEWLFPLVARDFYHSTDTLRITPPNIKRAYYASDERREIVLEFDQPVLWQKDSTINISRADTFVNSSMKDYFYLDRVWGLVDSGYADTSHNAILLSLKQPVNAEKITYLPGGYYHNAPPGPGYNEMWVYEGPWLYGTRGIGALSFDNIPIERNDSSLHIDTMLLDFYAYGGGMFPTDPIVRLTNTGIIPSPPLNAAADSSWLHVSITGSR